MKFPPDIFIETDKLIQNLNGNANDFKKCKQFF